MGENDQLRLLARWLAMPYGNNDPVFAVELPDGRPLNTGLMLRDLYASVVGPAVFTPGIWQQCPTCSHWEVRADTLPTDPGGIGAPPVVPDLAYATGEDSPGQGV
jgi:hypothetical protein